MAKELTVKEAALAILGRQSLSAGGLREKLRRKFPDQGGKGTYDDSDSHAGGYGDALDAGSGVGSTSTEIEEVIARFAELGLLDDAVYAETFARDRLLRGGYGRRRIAQDLERKGVAADDIAAAIESVVDEATERQMAERALERFRVRKARVDDPTKVREAAFRHLIGRGFAVSLVRDLLAVS